MEQKRPADIFQELLDYLWNGLGLEEKGWKRLKKGDFKKKMKNGLIYQICFDRSRYNMTFGEWLDLWYQMDSRPGLRDATRENYENWIYNHLIPRLGTVKIDELSQSDLHNFFITMKRGGRLRLSETKGKELSNRSVRSCWSVCKMALDRAKEERLININPAEGCRLPARNDGEMQILTQEEMKRFLIEADAEGFYELFLLELSTGLRRGELLALKWSDLSFKTGELRIYKQVHMSGGKVTISEPKTKAAHRSILLPPPVVDLLKAYKKNVYSEWMFPSRIKEDGPLDPSYVRKRLHIILERSLCRQVRFHNLRHTFVTMSLEKGMDSKTLSAIIGHASAETTLNVYSHVTDEMQESAAVRIDCGIAGVKSKPL